MQNAVATALAGAELLAACDQALAQGARFHTAWGWFPSRREAEVCYLLEMPQREPLLIWRCRPGDGWLPSLAERVPALSWQEREISDLCGIRFAGHPKPAPLVLHAGARPVLPPLAPDYPEGAPMPFAREPTPIPEVLGPDVQELPFGPVRADVVESAQFLFFYLGEHILHYQPRLFFKHRGMEKRFAGLAPVQGSVLAERISGVGSVAHALAYCQAVEAACGCTIPPRARQWRLVLAELERLYNHLHYFGHLADTTTLKVGSAEGKLLEERVKQINGRLTGNRLLRNILIPGGLRRELEVDQSVSAELERLRGEAGAYIAALQRTSSYCDRLLSTGALSAEIARRQGATGPVARAAGADYDLRRDHAYAAYGEFALHVPVRTAGDAQARAEVRAAELEASFALLQQALATLPPGAVHAPCVPVAGGEGLGWSESPRGAVFYAVHLDATGRLARVKVHSPSFANWRVFQYTVRDSNMMDYAINEASFGLTVAGCDR